jgi:hypothetical protein
MGVRDRSEAVGRLNRALAKATGDWIAWLNAYEYHLGGLRVLWRRAKDPVRTSCRGTASHRIGEGRVIGLRPQQSFSTLPHREPQNVKSEENLEERQLLEIACES